MKSKSAFKNLILDSLSNAELKKIENHLEEIEMPVGKVLYHPAEKIQHIYFPETSVISIVMVLENGDTLESGIIGKEGHSGAAVVLTEEVSPQEATVQLSGAGYRLPIKVFKNLFDENIDFRNVALRYLYAFVAQISQNAACQTHHNINQRLARWLLMFTDRAESDKLVMTQEFMAQMLGVHRPTVSKNANLLQKEGFISYNRGTVKILDRERLENFACECYRAIKQTLDGHTNIRDFEKSVRSDGVSTK